MKKPDLYVNSYEETYDEPFTPAFETLILEGEAALKEKEKKTGKKYHGADRLAAQVTGVVLHQMGFARGNEPKKYLPVTAHFIITRDGRLAQLHPVTTKLFSSNGLNATTVAVEIAGNLRNFRGQWWKGGFEDYLMRQQVSAGRFLLSWLTQTYGIREVYAHRQAHAGKPNCCGPEIWSSIGEWAIHEGGYDDCRDLTFRYKFDKDNKPVMGSPIPEQWRWKDDD